MNRPFVKHESIRSFIISQSCGTSNDKMYHLSLRMVMFHCKGAPMATIKEPVERRKNKRLLVREAAFVCFDANPAMMARIVDVSVGGLGITYRAPRRRKTDFFTLEIFCILYSFSLVGMPVRTVSDIETTVYGVRRRDVQFEVLTEDQKQRLEQFMDFCTTGEA